MTSSTSCDGADTGGARARQNPVDGVTEARSQTDRTTEFRTSSVEETEELGRRIGADLGGGRLIVLSGPLGAGKTAFVRGVAAGAGCSAIVSSPTFVLEHHYAGALPLLHVDLYRLASVDVADLAIDDVIAAGGSVLVEWGERLPADYRIQATRVTIAIDETGDAASAGEDGRTIRIAEPAA